jgi:hypothetical protein
MSSSPISHHDDSLADPVNDSAATTWNRRRVLQFGAAGAVAGAVALSPIGPAVARPITSGGSRPKPSLSFLSITVAGGFTPWQWAATSMPIIGVRDGVAISQGPQLAIYPGPALPNTRSRTVDSWVLRRLARIIRDAQLVGRPIDYGTPPVADVPTTTITFTIDGVTTTQTCFALGFDDGTTKRQRRARKRLADAIAQLSTLVTTDGRGRGPDIEFVPTSYELWGSKVDPSTAADPSLPNQLDLREWPFPDIDLAKLATDGITCVPAAASVRTVFQQATQSTLWRSGPNGSIVASVAIRPVLPGETACAR